MKKKILIFILLFTIYFSYTVDIDFDVFQYNGSRLKKILRYEKENKWPSLEMVYKYDDNGYLKLKHLQGYRKKNKSYFIYKSELRYDFNKNMIEEYFISIGRTITYEYYYNNKKQLDYYKRYRLNYKTNEDELIQDVDITYNEQGDIMSIIDKKGIAIYNAYFPGDGIERSPDKVIMKYIYEKDKKIRLKIRDDGTYYGKTIYHYNGDKLYLITFPASEGYYKDNRENTNLFEIELMYDSIGNIVKTIFREDNGNIKDTVYEYDKKNRLIKKIGYYTNTVAEGKISYREEYIYEDGLYVHYPYILPTTKIKIYPTDDTGVFIDKNP